MTTADEMNRFYEDGKEIDRLSRGIGPLEQARTQELISRFLPDPPCKIHDIGGAHGVYSFWLARLGYQVHLVDPMPVHIEEAKRINNADDSPKLAGIELGDARSLAFADSTADAVILHGPLYHLTDAEDRLLALREARRALKPGGMVLAFAISNHASSIVGITRGWVWNADYMTMCEREVGTGDHIRPTSWPSLFTTGYFHHPNTLRAELEKSGLACEGIFGVQGPGWMAPDFAESWNNPDRREIILNIARMMENEPVLSPHIMGVGRNIQC